MQHSRSRARYLPVAIFASVAVVGTVMFRDALSFEQLAENRETLLAYRDAHFTLLVCLFVAVYTAIVAFSLPGATVATLTGGFLFSVFPGTLFNVVAATTGATLLFLAVRWGGGARLAARMDQGGGRVARFKTAIDNNQWSALFLIRLAPVVPFFVANLIPGLLGVPLSRFAVSTFFGIMPGTFVYTSVGAGLGSVFETGETPDLDIIFEPMVLLPILGLALLSALPIVIKAVRGREL